MTTAPKVNYQLPQHCLDAAIIFFLISKATHRLHFHSPYPPPDIKDVHDSHAPLSLSSGFQRSFYSQLLAVSYKRAHTHYINPSVAAITGENA